MIAYWLQAHPGTSAGFFWLGLGVALGVVLGRVFSISRAVLPGPASTPRVIALRLLCMPFAAARYAVQFWACAIVLVFMFVVYGEDVAVKFWVENGP